MDLTGLLTGATSSSTENVCGKSYLPTQTFKGDYIVQTAEFIIKKKKKSRENKNDNRVNRNMNRGVTNLSNWPSFGQQYVHLQNHPGLALDMVEASSSFSQEPHLWTPTTKNHVM
ncbi:hypothetical protein DUI87_22307 [Hirundo rustica rustica]|uniref:Uncharacterized protein n=1 Tax=Hirundo rustica rustica TaxID=333673 RepID=A0A3M0JJE4_HIRRU|nr:hypothetical protein DUI87_22307 [Hirundo rustica rustica]